MKGAVYHGRHSLAVEELPVPSPGPEEVLLRVMACGVCGTDVHIYEGDPGAADCPPGTVIGHEFSGVVVAVGKQVKKVKPGDRVCADPNRLCGGCSYCLEGIGHFCERMTGYGTTVNGGFAEYCVVPQTQVYPVADGVTFAQAAMAEPVSCCLHGIDLCGIHPGDTVLIIGGGMIGLLMLQLARLSGAACCVLLEPVAEKREMAKRLGADLCIDPLNEDVVQVLEQHQVGRIGVVIECAGLKSTARQAISLAGRAATVLLFGLTKPEDEIPVRPFELFQKEITLKASYINPYTMGRAVRLINSGRLDVSSMVAEILPLERLEEVLANPELRAKGKYIIAPSGAEE